MTKQVEFQSSGSKTLDNLRKMTKKEFIKSLGSGTLRKSKKIGIDVEDLYWEERIAYEFGWEFMNLDSEFVSLKEVSALGDNKGITELGWHSDRYAERIPFEEDKIKVKDILYTLDEGLTYERGLGIVITQTSLEIPENQTIFAIVVPQDENGEWGEAQNPF